jgi:hypothetical protein
VLGVAPFVAEILRFTMPIYVQMRDGVAEAIFRGKIRGEDLQELKETIHEIESRMEITPDRISDLSDADVVELRSSDVVAFAESRGVAKLKNNVKSAIIAPGSTQFGLARMFLACNENPNIEITLFKDSASAYKWIGIEAQSVAGPNA